MDEKLHPILEILNKAAETRTAVAARNEVKSERDKQFIQVLREMSASLKAEQQRAALVKKKEAQASAENRARQQRINELYGLIAQLKSKLFTGVSTGVNKKIASQIAMLQSELFWLMLAF